MLLWKNNQLKCVVISHFMINMYFYSYRIQIRHVQTSLLKDQQQVLI